jgi:hypothetical protein
MAIQKSTCLAWSVLDEFLGIDVVVECGINNCSTGTTGTGTGTDLY